MAFLVNQRLLFVSDNTIVQINKHNPQSPKNKVEGYILEFVEAKTKQGVVFQMSLSEMERLINFNLLQKII